MGPCVAGRSGATILPMQDKVRLVTNVPEPPELTPEVLDEIAAQARSWHAEFVRQTAPMEWLTGDDLRILVR